MKWFKKLLGSGLRQEKLPRCRSCNAERIQKERSTLFRMIKALPIATNEQLSLLNQKRYRHKGSAELITQEAIDRICNGSNIITYVKTKRTRNSI